MRKSPKKPRKNAGGQEEVSSSDRDGNDVLGFHIVRRPRSSRDAMEDMNAAETLVLLQKPRGNDAIDNSDVLQKDNQKLDESLKFDEAMALINFMSLKQMTKSPKKPGQNDAGQEEVSSSARDGSDVLGFDILRRPQSSRVRDAMQEIDPADAFVLLQEPCGSDAIDNSDVLQKDYQKSTSNLKDQEPDHEVSDNSVVMQEEKQKVYLDAPAPSNSSEEETSDIIDGEANQTA